MPVAGGGFEEDELADEVQRQHAADGGGGANDKKKKKLRALVITMGGDRRRYVEEMFSRPEMEREFEPPVFVEGVPSRSLRIRFEFLKIANSAGLLPPEEWQALKKAMEDPLYAAETNSANSGQFFDCLQGVPVLSEGRRGSDYDKTCHYSVELWRKAKTINRGRAVLACTLAHLVALKRFTDEGFDVLLEDNVRAPLDAASCADRIRQVASADANNSNSGEARQCHFRYFGWLGSVPNLRWIYERHVPGTIAVREFGEGEEGTGNGCLFPFPTTEDIERDLVEREELVCREPGASPDDDDVIGEKSPNADERQPGGNVIWGCYGMFLCGEISRTGSPALISCRPLYAYIQGTGYRRKRTRES